MNGAIEAAGSSAPTKLSDRLANEETVLVERLGKVRILREQLERNSEVQDILDAFAQLGHFQY